jgi:hypothetical protein
MYGLRWDRGAAAAQRSDATAAARRQHVASGVRDMLGNEDRKQVIHRCQVEGASRALKDATVNKVAGTDSVSLPPLPPAFGGHRSLA